MSDLDFVNFLMINDVGHSTKNNEKLGDLRDRAAYIAEKTGQKPISWYEFKQSTPQEEPHTLRNMAIGIAVGLGIAACLSFTAFALPLAILGAAAGIFSDTANTRRNQLVGKYENYLDQFEHSASRGRAYELDAMPPLREGENVARLREASPAQAQGMHP